MLFARGRSGPVILMMRMTLSFTGGKGKHFSVKGREEYKPVRKRKEPSKNTLSFCSGAEMDLLMLSISSGLKERWNVIVRFWLWYLH